MHLLFYSATLLVIGQVFVYLPDAAGETLNTQAIAIAGVGIMAMLSWLAAMSSWSARPGSAGDCMAQAAGIGMYLMALLLNWGYLVGLPEQLPEHLVNYGLAVIALLVIFAPTALVYAGPIRPYASGSDLNLVGLMSLAFFAILLFSAILPAAQSLEPLVTEWSDASGWTLLGYIPPIAIFGSLFALIALVFGYGRQKKVDSTVN